MLALAATFLSACKKDDYKGEIVGDCPVVVSTDPADKAVDVALAKVITVTFNTGMAKSTLTDKTFIIKQGATVVAGTIAATADTKVYTFTPTQPLSPFAVYTGTITTGATDTLRTAMVADYVWSFTTIPQVTLSLLPGYGRHNYR
jgi:hypothetical protein